MQSLVQTINLQVLLLGQQHLRAAEVQVKNTTQPRLWLEVTLLGLLPSTLAGQVAPVAGARGGPSTRLSPSRYRCPLLHNAPPLQRPPSTTPPLSTPVISACGITPPGGSFPPRQKLLGHLLPLLPKIQPRQPRHLSHPQALPLLTVRHPRLQVSLII